MENCNNPALTEDSLSESQPSIFEQQVPLKAVVNRPKRDITSEVSLENDIIRRVNDTSLKAYDFPSPGLKPRENGNQPHPIFGETSDDLSYESNFESLNFDTELKGKKGFKNQDLLNIKFKTYSLVRENGIEIQSAGLKPKIESLGTQQSRGFGNDGSEIQSAKLKPQKKKDKGISIFSNFGDNQKHENDLNLARKFSDIVEENNIEQEEQIL